ncbi:hypothetical protein LguiA_014931 [Lonicera macranthoides]
MKEKPFDPPCNLYLCIYPRGCQLAKQTFDEAITELASARTYHFNHANLAGEPLLMDLDLNEVQHLLESPEALKAKVAEAMEVIRNVNKSLSATIDDQIGCVVIEW